MLENGLRALLISDYSGPAASEDEDSDGEDDYEEEGEEDEEDDETGDETGDESEDEDHDERGSDDDDDDKEGKKKKGNAEKQVPVLELVALKQNKHVCCNWGACGPVQQWDSVVCFKQQ